MNAAHAPTPVDRWHSGEAYERYMGRWSRQLAPRFLHGLGVPPARRWLDVGCGTGALCAAILDHCAPTALTGVDPSAGFLASARRTLPPQVLLQQADAARLPLPDQAVDVTASALVLNFVPDAAAALHEMVRVTVPGGAVAACVWDYGGTMDLIRLYWQAAAAVDPEARTQDQGERFPLCRPDALAAAFTGVGLQQEVVQAIDLSLRCEHFDDYWLPFLGGQGPAPAHAMSLPEELRERLRVRLRASLPTQADGSVLLAARAWAVWGLVGGRAA